MYELEYKASDAERRLKQVTLQVEEVIRLYRYIILHPLIVLFIVRHCLILLFPLILNLDVWDSPYPISS